MRYHHTPIGMAKDYFKSVNTKCWQKCKATGALIRCWWEHKMENILALFFFFFLWLCWVFVSVRGLSLVAASGGHSSSRCAGLSLSWPLLLRSTGSKRAGSAIVAHEPSCSMACGIFPDQGSNPCPLHWQADSQPLHHQGSPALSYRIKYNLPYEPAVSLLSIYPWEMKTYVCTKICMQMFTAALYIIAKNWKPFRCPSKSEQISKLWYIHTKEYYSVIKINILLIHLPTRKNHLS